MPLPNSRTERKMFRRGAHQGRPLPERREEAKFRPPGTFASGLLGEPLARQGVERRFKGSIRKLLLE